MNIAKDWLKAAYDDILLLNDIIHNKYITNMVAFHSQQAIEKSLKAYLEYHSRNIPKTHKIQALIDIVDIGIHVNDTLIQLLDDLYIESRYPGYLGLLPNGKPSLEYAKEFYDFALMIFNRICELLNIDKNELIDKY
ncbi:MAG TPA: HEPN domain-containing protein [Spirochaetota bacterium]|nr:HEPN domain-containing protein [Spirochaetota bacterium]